MVAPGKLWGGRGAGPRKPPGCAPASVRHLSVGRVALQGPGRPFPERACFLSYLKVGLHLSSVLRVLSSGHLCLWRGVRLGTGSQGVRFGIFPVSGCWIPDPPHPPGLADEPSRVRPSLFFPRLDFHLRPPPSPSFCRKVQAGYAGAHVHARRCVCARRCECVRRCVRICTQMCMCTQV